MPKPKKERLDLRKLSIHELGELFPEGGIPKFPQDDLKPWQTVRVHFKDEEGMKSFSDLVGQEITPITKMIWYPKAAIGSVVTKRVRELLAESLKERPSGEVGA
jgi:hypothetical protein